MRRVSVQPFILIPNECYINIASGYFHDGFANSPRREFKGLFGRYSETSGYRNLHIDSRASDCEFMNRKKGVGKRSSVIFFDIDLELDGLEKEENSVLEFGDISLNSPRR